VGVGGQVGRWVGGWPVCAKEGMAAACGACVGGWVSVLAGHVGNGNIETEELELEELHMTAKRTTCMNWH